MALNPTYSVGTVSVSAGSAIVNGNGTLFVAGGLRAGDVFERDGLSVTLAETPTSNTQLTLVKPWPGATGSGSYEVRYTADAARVIGAARTVVDRFEALQPVFDGAYASYASLLEIAPTLSPTVRYVQAVVEGGLAGWVRDVTGTALGGGWKAAGEVSPRSFGGSLAAAHATGKPVDYGDRLWPGDSSVGYMNCFGFSKYRTALESRLQAGLAGSPVADPRPVSATVKFTSADRADDPGAWTQTGYYGLVKRSGDAYGAALTGYARSDGGAGDMIGTHGRAHSSVSGVGQLFGMWAYASYDGANGLPLHLTGMEINVVNRSGDSDFAMPSVGGNAEARGIALVTADGAKRAQIGVSVERMGGTAGWLLGMRVRADSIVPSLTPGAGRTCAFRVEGGLSAATSYGGISFEGAYFDYGLDFSQLTQPFKDNAAIRLRPNDRIYFGDDAANRYISRPSGRNAINFNNLSVEISGQQVLTARQPAIANAASGTEAATINAVLAALRAHGLINP